MARQSRLPTNSMDRMKIVVVISSSTITLPSLTCYDRARNIVTGNYLLFKEDVVTKMEKGF